MFEKKPDLVVFHHFSFVSRFWFFEKCPLHKTYKNLNHLDAILYICKWQRVCVLRMCASICVKIWLCTRWAVSFLLFFIMVLMCGCREAKPSTFFRIHFSLFSVVSHALQFLYFPFAVFFFSVSFKFFVVFLFSFRATIFLYGHYIRVSVCLYHFANERKTTNDWVVQTSKNRTQIHTNVQWYDTFCHIFTSSQNTTYKKQSQKKTIKWEKKQNDLKKHETHRKRCRHILQGRFFFKHSEFHISHRIG